MIGAAVAAAVLILLPLVDDFANVFAGLGGAVVGAACGLVAAYARRERHPGWLTVAHEKFISLTPELHDYPSEHSSFRDGAGAEVEQAGGGHGRARGDADRAATRPPS